MTYEFKPLIEAPTTITDATPMIIPIKVRKARSLCVAMAWMAILKASE
jgi:hypothetical protein